MLSLEILAEFCWRLQVKERVRDRHLSDVGHPAFRSDSTFLTVM